MPRTEAPISLVGSVPLADAEQVLAAGADAIGGHVFALPDGETRYRTNWINFQAYFVHHPHPDLETLQRPGSEDGVLQWSPHGFEDLWSFRVREGVDRVEYDELFYADEAIRSWVAFRDLRDVGRIPDGVRFQVALPTPPGGIWAFFRADGDDHEKVLGGYTAALRREIERILEVIPAADLAVQWDICNEVMDMEGAYPWMPGRETAWERYTTMLSAIATMVPDDALVGLHLCYGDLGGHHIVEPADLGLLTRMVNEAVVRFDRPVDWVHVPVPIARDDDAYFAPLADLDAPDAQLFLGLIHPQDGVDGARRRFEAARRVVDTSLGVATECGFGRRDPGTVRPLLQLHRDVAEQVLLGSRT